MLYRNIFKYISQIFPGEYHMFTCPEFQATDQMPSEPPSYRVTMNFFGSYSHVQVSILDILQ